jgi:hypothetical protein
LFGTAKFWDACLIVGAGGSGFGLGFGFFVKSTGSSCTGITGRLNVNDFEDRIPDRITIATWKEFNSSVKQKLTTMKEINQT